MNTLQLSGLELKLVKDYDFRTMSMGQLLTEFRTANIWPRKQPVNKEVQTYLDPEAVPPEHNPFVLSGKGLSIVCKPTDPAIAEQARSLNGDDILDYDDDIKEEELAKSFIQPYTSGVLSTRKWDGEEFKGFKFKYGYYESSMKLPAKLGAWPAIWDLAAWKNWEGPSPTAEGDAMESFSMAEAIAGEYSVNVHTYKAKGHEGVIRRLEQLGIDGDIQTGVDLTAEYHRYGQLRTPEHIAFYFDGEEVLRVDMPEDMKGERSLILNLAVGGDPSWREQPDLDDKEPFSLDVEYMRVWELDESRFTASAEVIKTPAVDASEPVRGDIIATIPSGPLAGRQVTSADVNLLTELLIHLPQLLSGND